jgi:excisionase family DNA binding protein
MGRTTARALRGRSAVSSLLAEVLLAELDDDALDALAQLLRPRLQVGVSEPTRYLDAAAAADYLACSRKRIYELTERGALTPRRDGRRLLFRSYDLDAYLERSA